MHTTTLVDYHYKECTELLGAVFCDMPQRRFFGLRGTPVQQRIPWQERWLAKDSKRDANGNFLGCRWGGTDHKGACCRRDHRDASYNTSFPRTSYPSTLTEYLGTGRKNFGQSEPWELPVDADSHCSADGEQAKFARQCASTIRYMDAALKATRHRRGLLVRLASPKPEWGWGHVLSTAMAWHFVCVRLHRFCYIEAFDSDLQRLFGYASGMLWAADSEELRPYGPSFAIVNQSRIGRLYQNPLWGGLLAQLESHADKRLIELTIEGTPPFTSYRWLPYDLPLRFDRRALLTPTDAEVLERCLQMCVGRPSDASSCESRCLGRFEWAVSRLDRCFCRYVTQPLFEPSTYHRRAGSLPVAFHLRTGYADISDEALQWWARRRSADITAGAKAATRSQRASASSAGASLRTWFDAACNGHRFASQSSWVMSDNPFLLRHLHERSYGDALIHSNLRGVPRLTRMTASTSASSSGADANEISSTRVWRSSFEPKLETALDVYVAGLVPEIQVSPHTTFARPIVARSICTSRVVNLVRDGACPQWDAQFYRNLFSWAASPIWPCVRAVLPAGHGCGALEPTVQGGEVCQQYYINSMMTSA